MIWFSCKQCGKVHGRAENSIGTMIFCECGQGVLVPWESTVPEPEAPVPVGPAPPPLKLEPVMFDPVASGAKPPHLGRAQPARRRPRLGPRDPDYCFNHEELPKQAPCADCGESFCSSCLVTFQGKSLCGPCKNYRVRGLLAPRLTPRLAQASAFLAFVPAFFLIAPAHASGLWFLGVLALGPQLAALIIGILALRQAEHASHSVGRALALTGVIGAVVTSLLIVLLTLHVPRIWT